MHIGIAAIVRNEAPYLLEWLSWHRALGVESFIIYDNVSNDGTTELLAALARAGIVKHVLFPDPPGQRPQVPAYLDILVGNQLPMDWLGIIDADEFIYPTGSESLGEILGKIDPSADAVAMNWAMYGTSGLTSADDPILPSPTITRFTRRAQKDDPKNFDVKSFLRPERFRRVDVGVPYMMGVHAFKHEGNTRYVAPNGTALPELPANARAKQVSWDKLRLNHYCTRSRNEYFFKKIVRGDAGCVVQRDMSSFIACDLNDISETVPEERVAKTLAGIAELRACLASHGAADWQPEPLECEVEQSEIEWSLSDMLVNLQANRLMLCGTYKGTAASPNLVSNSLYFALSSAVLPVRAIHLLPGENSTGIERLPKFRILLDLPRREIAPDEVFEIYTPESLVMAARFDDFLQVKELPYDA